MSNPKTAPSRAVDGRIELRHGLYLIIAGASKGACRAVAYLGRRKVDAADGETIEAAIERLKGRLDERSARRMQERKDGVPTVAEIRDALLALPASQKSTVLPLLLAHGRMPGAELELTELARRFRIDEAEAVAAYARLGRALSALLDFAPKVEGTDRRYAAMSSFAMLEPVGDGGACALRLRPQLVAALHPRAALAAVPSE